MAQLKMYRFPDAPINEVPLPEGYSISKYTCPADKLSWCECCKDGLVGDDATEKTFDECITNDINIDIYNDVFFLDYNGEHIGTVTAFVNRGNNTGDMHMVAIRKDFRGKGLAKYLTFITVNHLKDTGVKWTVLTTDEWRKGAVKSYLTGGFKPVEYDEGMQERWAAVLADYGMDSVEMYNEDGSFFGMIKAKK